MGTNLGYGQRACKQGVSRGLQAYFESLKTWLPLPGSEPRKLENPLRSGLEGFFEGAALAERPEHDILRPLVRAVRLYAALIGGRGRAVPSSGPGEDRVATDDLAEQIELMARTLQ